MRVVLEYVVSYYDKKQLFVMIIGGVIIKGKGNKKIRMMS